MEEKIVDMVSDEVLNLFLKLAVAVLASVIPAVYVFVWQWFKSQFLALPEERREALRDAAVSAARFAEQLGLSDLDDNILRLADGKMNAALTFALAYLREQGYSISNDTEEALRGLIEEVILLGLHDVVDVGVDWEVTTTED